MLVGTALLCVSPTALGQSESPPIWKGVFSAAQAERGKAVVDAHCIRCHAASRPLSGDLFMLHWEGHTVARLFRKMKETMPPNQADAVSDQEKLDALAFVLQQNGFPAGEADVADVDALAALHILPREGPRPMKTGMAAEVIGCLSKSTGSSWVVTNATDPAPSTVDSSDLTAAAAAPLGTQTFQLLFPPKDPEPLNGKKVHVIGLLIRHASGDRLNVIALAPVAQTCTQ
jgi:hypothetical protein